MCQPRDEVAFIMGVGQRYYSPQSFVEEAMRLGVSKRIPAVPKDLVLGQTVVYLSHPHAVEVKEAPLVQYAMDVARNLDSSQQTLLLDAEHKPEYALGIFCAFVPRRIEMLVWESEATPERLENLRKRGITPVLVPDGDEDHCGSKVGA